MSIGNDIYQENEQQIEDDIKRRTAEHQAEVARTKQLFGFGPGRLIGIADGDSWFDYPLPPVGATDVRDALQNAGALSPILLKLAHHGDATTALLGVQKRRRLINALEEKANGPIEIILFSGGGNDLVGDQFLFWVNDAANVGHDATDGVNTEALANVLGVVMDGYLELIQIRDSLAPTAVLFLHAYDYAYPTGKAACPFAGPWLLPSLTERGWNEGDGKIIVEKILAEFQNRLESLAQRHEHVVVVPTQGTLGVDDWANELHPTPSGFRLIAEKFRVAISTQFPGRI
ncbi:SGNH/GDSL hydrolase family protein [Paraburkholderia sp.]|uniref:SGNH/GDSL hydrolase family protein n=1 Tax=Paraburkholderia sp. TaxID=1926495 RepID=UPI00286F3F96|nr:SGNH/GDSL hydrolase family protein [Paraburkholderia sp.]